VIFDETRIADVWLVRGSPRVDERGWFTRTFCSREFSGRGLVVPGAQSNLSFNSARSTLRGLHWQRAPHGEAKLVRCVRGAIWDVVADVRTGSPTCGSWQAFELTGENLLSLYIPEGVAHGLLTLQPESLVHYQMSAEYYPQAAAGLRWNDPAFAIDWPLVPAVISERDRHWPDWKPLNRTPIPDQQGGDLYASRR